LIMLEAEPHLILSSTLWANQNREKVLVTCHRLAQIICYIVVLYSILLILSTLLYNK
jgi:hypothetical protein